MVICISQAVLHSMDSNPNANYHFLYCSAKIHGRGPAANAGVHRFAPNNDIRAEVFHAVRLMAAISRYAGVQ